MSCHISKLWWKQIVIHRNGTLQESHTNHRNNVTPFKNTHKSNASCLLLGMGNPLLPLLIKGRSVSIRARQLKSRNFGFVHTKLHVASWDLSILMFLHDLKSLKFGMFLLVPTLLVLKSFSLKKLGFAYNPTCPFALDDLSPRLGYFSMFCGLILDQHMPKESLLFAMANKFVEVVRHPLKITAISARVQRM